MEKRNEPIAGNFEWLYELFEDLHRKLITESEMALIIIKRFKHEEPLEDMAPDIKFALDRFSASLKCSPYAEAGLKRNFAKKIRRFINQNNKS